jgi:hypothetical protein
VNSHWDEPRAAPKGSINRFGALELEHLNFGASFHGPSWAVSVKTKERLSILSLGYFQNISTNLTYGTLINYSINSNIQNLAMATQYISKSKGSRLKCKINSAAVIGISIKHSLFDDVTITICRYRDLDRYSVRYYDRPLIRPVS